MSSVVLRLGDNLELLKQLPDNSVDSVVTDPPYGISFMGKKWDYDVPSVELWKEVLRVLKPGGHALVACGTRTQHRMAVNLEDAGFEIRDIVAWLYGSGFPKSLDISKAIDKKEGYWRGRAGKVISDNTSMSGGNYERTDKGKPITEEAKQWEGWGTALKPAMELWTLCRKPLGEKTVAENVLKYGTGGINIDECRVPTDEILQPSTSTKMKYGGNSFNESSTMNDPNWVQNENGRFPANVIHDGSEEVVSLFPDSKSGKYKGEGTKSGGIWSKSTGKPAGREYGDSGSASRFFYTAKVSKKERSCDGKVKNNDPTVKPVALMRYLCRLITPPNGVVLDPYMGSGSTGIAALLEGFNFIGMEREEEYMEIAKARIGAYE